MVQANSMSVIGSSAWEVPPISKLGRVYVVMTYMYPSAIQDQGPYEIMVVATEDGTLVEVQLKGPLTYRLTFNGTVYRSGQIIHIELNKYQTAQVSHLQ